VVIGASGRDDAQLSSHVKTRFGFTATTIHAFVKEFTTSVQYAAIFSSLHRQFYAIEFPGSASEDEFLMTLVRFIFSCP
jgi:hypothetical protein